MIDKSADIAKQIRIMLFERMIQTSVKYIFIPLISKIILFDDCGSDIVIAIVDILIKRMKINRKERR